MRILALEPFFGGSHRAFLEGWRRNSRHDWTVIGLPGCHWKWRMRHAALQCAGQVHESWRDGSRWDAILCSDMLDLAQFRGLTAKILANVPAVAYFHENQLTYPVRAPHERDLHFAFTNFMTAVAADQIWFNSAFHRGEFLDAVTKWLRKMPDFVPDQEAVLVRKKSVVQSPGIDDLDRRRARISGPLRIAWAARWEHDKNPEVFFDGSPYQLSQCLSTLSNDVSLLNRPAQVHVLTAAADRYRWPRRAAAMDDSLERIANRCLM